MLFNKCEIDGCENHAKARGMCGNHYALWRRNGKPERIAEKVDYGPVCSVDGCDLRHSAKGFCSMHYARHKKYGSTDLPPKRKAFVCSVDGCDADKHKAKGFCERHYEAYRARRSLETLPERRTRRTVCDVDGCDRPHRTKGFCSKHYQRWRMSGDPLSANAKKPNGSGKEWHTTKNGYVVRYEPSNPNAGPNGQVYQHRHIMSRILGRPLKSGENVHHKNGNRADNSDANLELWETSQPSGQRIQDKAAWCADYLIEHMQDALRLDAGFAEKLSSLAAAIKK